MACKRVQVMPSCEYLQRALQSRTSSPASSTPCVAHPLAMRETTSPYISLAEPLKVIVESLPPNVFPSAVSGGTGGICHGGADMGDCFSTICTKPRPSLEKAQAL